MNRTPTPQIQFYGGQLVGPMGEFYGNLYNASPVFAARLVEAVNAHDELVAALRKIDEFSDSLSPEGAAEIARAALAKVAS